jgi:hypothetical protein
MFTFILIVISAIANAFMDQIHKGTFNHKGQWWNWNTSWKLKWKVDNNGEPIRPLTPRFFLSTSVLVGITDAWHFFKMIVLFCFWGAIVSYTTYLNMWLDFFILYLLWSGTFHVTYHYFLNPKK